MSLCLVDIHGDIEGDYEIIRSLGFTPALGQIPTNGDVIKTMFPNLEIEYTDTDEYTNKPRYVKLIVENKIIAEMSADRWNAPYKGSED